MKIRALICIFLFSVGSPCFAEYRPTADEWGIPQGIKTEADIVRYEKYRKRFAWAGVGLLAGSVAAFSISGRYRKRAGGMQVYGSVISVPAPNGGSTGVLTTLPGALERRDRLYSRGATWKTVGIVGGLVGTILLSVAFSLRF